MYTVVHLHILTTDGAMQPPYLEYLQIESSINLWFEHHFVSQKFYYYTTVLFIRGENLCLLNRKNLKASLFQKIADPLCRCSLYVGTLPIFGMIYFLLHANNSILNLYTLYCPRLTLTKLVRGLWNGLRTCVCVRLCVRPCVNEKCYFSSISWPILILFVLSDRAWWGLQNFYTEFWNSLIMQIYANLFKINEKCYFSVISWPILILFVLSDRAWEKCYFSVISWPILILFGLSDWAWCGLQNFYTEFWNSLIMQIYAYLFKSNKNCYFSISQRILILFVLSDRAWWGLRNFYTELWNSLILQIYANLFKITEKCRLSSIQKSQQICTWGGDVYYASRNLLFTCSTLFDFEIDFDKVNL